MWGEGCSGFEYLNGQLLACSELIAVDWVRVEGVWRNIALCVRNYIYMLSEEIINVTNAHRTSASAQTNALDQWMTRTDALTLTITIIITLTLTLTPILTLTQRATRSMLLGTTYWSVRCISASHLLVRCIGLYRCSGPTCPMRYFVAPEVGHQVRHAKQYANAHFWCILPCLE